MYMFMLTDIHTHDSVNVLAYNFHLSTDILSKYDQLLFSRMALDEIDSKPCLAFLCFKDVLQL